MVIALIAITASSTGRLTLRSASMAEGSRRAARHAESGVDYALGWLNSHPDWRTALASGVLSAAVLPDPTGGGSFRWSVTDADGDLADDPRDHAVLRSIGYSGDSVWAVEVGIEPAGRSLTCLEATMHAATTATLANSSQVNGNGVLSAGGEVTANSASVGLDAESASTINGGTFHGASTEGLPARESPGGHVFDWYVSRGTEIELTSLPDASGVYQLHNARLGRSINDYGEANPRGIYWIDCGGADLSIARSRLLGTLVLLNAGPGTAVSNASLLQTEALNYPTLLVDGNLSVDLRNALVGQQLVENFPYNFNPFGFPYEGGEDIDSLDTYPSRIDGLIYVSGALRFTDDSVIDGVVVAGSVEVASSKIVQALYRPYASYYPPPGFSAGQGVRLLPGTWRRIGL